MTLAVYDDDGFERTLPASDRLLKGLLANWTDAKLWHDRDGLPVPSPQLVIGKNTALQRWKNKIPEVIIDKPLPDPDELNNAILMSEWEMGLDGKPRPPWAKVYALYMVDMATGQTYTALNCTKGWRIAFEALSEAVTVKRMLHGGARMFPIVNLETRPFKTQFGMRTRPHLAIVGWRTAGDGGVTPLPAATPTPQLNAPAATPAATPAAAPMSSPKAQLDAFAAADSKAHPAETAANLKNPPEPVSSKEYFSDEIPW